MSYKQGENREQMTLIPVCFDDYIGADSVCRVIDAFVNSLDLAGLGFKYTELKNTGRPPYDPKAMLKLYIYGYMNRVRSSRRLEAEATRNIEVMWLLEKLVPDDKTICNFRKDNAKQLKSAFREFSLMCNKLNLFGKELIAVDGTKNRANSSRKNIHTKKGTEKKLAEIEKKISEYMNELERNDESEKDDEKLDESHISEILEHLKSKKETLVDWLKKIEENDSKEISTVDPEAHLMHTNGDGRPLDACYNVQTVVDSKHKLIVDFEVTTCPDDKNALPEMTEKAKEIMCVDTITVTADTGYYDGEDIEKCEQNGTVTYVAKNSNDYAHAPDRNYDKSKFRYDSENDCYICPEGKILPFRQLQKHKDDKYANRIYYDTKVCRCCPNCDKCTTNKRSGRHISRTHHQDALDRNNERMRENYEVFAERKKIVEHPFGTTKAVWGYKQYLCRGQERTTAEQSLAFLAYNLRRVINIFKANDENLIAAMG
jgi:transposase